MLETGLVDCIQGTNVLGTRKIKIFQISMTKKEIDFFFLIQNNEWKRYVNTFEIPTMAVNFFDGKCFFFL